MTDPKDLIIGVFWEDARIVVAIPLIETSDGAALDMVHAAGVIGEVARSAMNDLYSKIIAGEQRKAKRAKK